MDLSPAEEDHVGGLVGTGGLGPASHFQPGQQAKRAAEPANSPAALAAGLPPDAHLPCLLAQASALLG